MRVCAILVAFDPKKGFLHRVIEQAVREGVEEVVVVDNSPGKVFLNCAFNSEVRVVPSPNNSGSAGGFQLGLQVALQGSCEYFWLLDEDNYAQPGALATLKAHWQEQCLVHERFMLLSFRPRLMRHLNPRYRQEEIKILAPDNSYLGFHFRQILNLIRNRIFPKPGPLQQLQHHTGVISMDAAYYGGLFLHRGIAADGFLPDGSLVLYWDDIDYSRRFLQEEGKVLLVPSSRILDLDRRLTSLRGGFWRHPLLDLQPAFKAFYYTRNLLIHQRRFSAKNAISFAMNRALFKGLLLTLCFLRKKRNRYRLFLAAEKASKKELLPVSFEVPCEGGEEDIVKTKVVDTVES